MNGTEPDDIGEPANDAISIAAISARLTSLEDRLEILNVLAGLPHSSDVGDLDYQNRAYHENCVMDRDNANALVEGKTAIVDIIGSEQHRLAIKNGMVHFAGLPRIRIKGARATATGYLQIVVPIAAGQGAELCGYGPSDGLAIWRLTANMWELEKDGGRWSIIRRIIRGVPGNGFHEIIAEGLK